MYEIDDESPTHSNEGVLAARINFALQHIDSPILMLPRERALLARHIAIRLTRNKGKRIYAVGGGLRE